MPNRLDIEITSQTTDSSYTWRSAGAKEPKGTIKASLLPSGVAIGDVLKVEADFMIDGIEITAVLPQKAKKDGPELLELFGIPYIQAPSEGEATAALLTQTGHADIAASQDFDSILFGAKKLVRNFTNSGRRKLPNRNTYIEVEPEVIDYKKNLEELGITGEQLIDVGILIGTDFNPDGFERVGPKTAIKMIREHGKLEDIPQIREQLEVIDYNAIRKIFLKPETAKVDKIEFSEIRFDAITDYLSNERSFSRDRVASSLKRLKKSLEKKSQTLEKWF